MLTPNEKTAWAAGFFDGEGCVHINPTLKYGRLSGYSFCVSVAQTRTEPLMLLQELFGGYLTERKTGITHKKRVWVWTLHGADCARFLEKVLPALRVKFIEAAIGLWFHATCKYRGKRIPVAVHEIRKYLSDECSAEKRLNF